MTRRMFSQDIVCSEEFIDMSVSSRDLYYQLAIRADDDGFVQPKSIMRLIGSSQDDLKILITKRFILPFNTGVVVIKHWLIHNMIRLDRYKETRFIKEKSSLFIKPNKVYTDNENKGVPLLATNWQPTGNQWLPQVRLGKDRIDLPQAEKEVFDFQSYLTGMKDSTDNRMRIIRAYWLYKKFTFANHEQAKRQIRRDLRSATDLACYSDKQIKNTFDYLQNKDFKWTLETTIKYINEYGQ